MPQQLLPGFAEVMAPGAAGLATDPVHLFTSLDEQWKLELARDNLTLVTSSYYRWEEFFERLSAAIRALRELYSPAFYTRIGLRYRDVIDRAELGLGSLSWSELVKPHIASILATPDGENADAFLGHGVIPLDQYEGRVRIIYGLGQLPTGKIGFFIDSDFFTEARTNANDAGTTLGYFNECGLRLFRWCITDELHRAMGPRAVADGQ